jgi:hypothetical protein
MDIGHLLSEQQKLLFVGREKELAILEQNMSDPQWKLLHIYGPGGIGKTTLIQLFAQLIRPYRSIYVDGHSDFQRPHDFLAHIRQSLPASADSTEEIDMLNAYAIQQEGVILLLDTFEKCGAIEDWLRKEWFPKLSPLVKICTAGRYPLEDQWIRNGWQLFIHNMELQPLSFDEIQAYTHIRGIHNQDIVNSLQRFSNGLPLALSIACEIILRKDSTLFLDRQQKDQIITYLVAELTRDIEESYLKRYTEAASMVWRFDQELLQFLLKENIPIEHFREFCRLPFVIRQADHWSLHDSIRQWVFTDLRSRMPQTFQIYRRHALEVLLKRESLLPHKKTELAFERLYLHELVFVRDFRFQWDDCLRFRECREQQLGLVEQLYLEYLHNQTNFIHGETHLETLISPLWSIDPSAFYGLWRDKELVAFCSCILLTEQTVQIFRTNPLTTPVTSRFNPSRRQYLLCLTGVATHLEQNMTGSVARALVHIIERNKDADFLDLISIPYWSHYLPLLGFQRTPWADSTTPLGVQYTGHELDLHHEDFSSRLNRMYSTIESTASLEQIVAVKQTTVTTLSLEAAVKLVQRALKHFPRLPLYPEIVHTLTPLLPETASDWGTERIAQQVQDKMRGILQTFRDGSEEEQRFYRILHNAYMKKIGTHEVVSEYLNIPIKSYYRYLQSAVRSLTYEMIKEHRGRGH